jgi:hypothetical protein
VICRLFNLAAPAAMAALAIGSWKLNALQDLLHEELGLTVGCPYGLNFCCFSRILFLEVSKTPVNFRFRDLLSFQHASL